MPQSPLRDDAPESANLAAEANRCVACGLCVPQCPTYRLLESEADSPRGRVMLMRALFEGSLGPEPDLVTHLDRCLACRTCEAVCPSGVRYGELIDGARAHLARLGSKPRGIARLAPGLLASATVLGLNARLRFRTVYPAVGARRGTVELFLGCVSQLADGDTLAAAILVLNRLGYEVRVPRGQGCCGAMHRHGGDPETAERLARRNVAACAGDEAAPLLFTASGCGAELVEYGRYGEGFGGLAARARDVVSFLAHAEGWAGMRLAPLDGTIAVHEPCSARNVLGNVADVHRLLERIPGARVVPLPGNAQCCGSAGLYFLREPELARRLRASTGAAVAAARPDVIVSTNYGCARWLKSGLRAAGSRVKVVHPVLLIARQLRGTE